MEKGFFIDSTHSLPLQLCDLFALSLRKQSEIKAGTPAKTIDASGITRAEALVHRGMEANRDVMAWLARQNADKKEATGG